MNCFDCNRYNLQSRRQAQIQVQLSVNEGNMTFCICIFLCHGVKLFSTIRKPKGGVMRLNLSEEDIFFIAGDARKVAINCETGTLWVTQPNDRKDHILRAGESFNATSRVKWLWRRLQRPLLGFQSLPRMQPSPLSAYSTPTL